MNEKLHVSDDNRCDWCGKSRAPDEPLLWLADSGELFHKECHEKLSADGEEHSQLLGEWRP